MDIFIKRAYDKPKSTDGSRILIDRLWPRGVSKEEAAITYWAKVAAPSTELRKWFHEQPEKRFESFRKKYQKELLQNKKAIVSELAPFKKKITLITAVKDIEHSQVPTLHAFLKKAL